MKNVAIFNDVSGTDRKHVATLPLTEAAHLMRIYPDALQGYLNGDGYCLTDDPEAYVAEWESEPAKGAENVLKTLDISIGHLPRATVERIEAGGFPKPPMMDSEYGFLFSVPDGGDVAAHVSDMAIACDSFVACLQRAADLGCAFLMFDRDSMEIEDLPVFDW
mgnify:CR=1 FL=1